MVRDVRGVIDFLAEGKNRFGFKISPKFKANLPSLNQNHIFCLGYSLGGTVALYAAALDKRITGVASFSGFTPMRTDTDQKNTGGIRRFWSWHALQPQLGLFRGREKELPYDFNDILSLIAPRSCLVVSPKYDREADSVEITRCVDIARDVWKAQNAECTLTHFVSEDYNRFQSCQHYIFLDWIKRVLSDS